MEKPGRWRAKKGRREEEGGFERKEGRKEGV